jgi:hypothetical protein
VLGEGPPLEDGFIEPPVPAEQLRQDPYPLPKDFEWSTVDIQDPEQVSRLYTYIPNFPSLLIQIKEVYDLLSGHYVEDDDASFRFQYTAEFFQWCAFLSLHYCTFDGITYQGSWFSWVLQGMARRSARFLQQEACSIHIWCPNYYKSPQKVYILLTYLPRVLTATQRLSSL